MGAQSAQRGELVSSECGWCTDGLVRGQACSTCGGTGTAYEEPAKPVPMTLEQAIAYLTDPTALHSWTWDQAALRIVLAALEWYPMETAPKDGTEFLAHYNRNGALGWDLVVWMKDSETVTVELGDGLFRREERDTSGFCGNLGSGPKYLKWLTHWRPLHRPLK